jgi:hypothetical protein
VFPLGVTLTAAALCGCYPAMVRTSPRITGSLMVDGIPAAQAKVFIQTNANKACNSSSRVTVTDEQGSFDLPLQRRFEWYPVIQLGDRISGWRVCFEYKERYYLGYREMHMGLPQKRAHLECDLMREAPSNAEGSRHDQICQGRKP